MRRMGGKKGFTLVELSLSVGFIALLSLTITLIINDTVATYRRGLTLNEITTTGMDLVDDIRAAIQNSPARAANYECGALYDGTIGDERTNAGRCYKDQAKNLVVLQRTAEVAVEEDQPTAVLPVYGVICTGEFTYIWNSGYFFGENNGGEIANSDDTVVKVQGGIQPASFKYSSQGTDGKAGETKEFGTNADNQFRLLKLKDERRAVCKKAIKNSSDMDPHYGTYLSNESYNETLTNEFNLVSDGSDSALNFYKDGIRDGDIEVVLDDDITNQLALYDLLITPPVTNASGESAFYSASFILGTVTGGINIAAKGNFCNTPEDYDEDFDYCAINKFNFAAQATGG